MREGRKKKEKREQEKRCRQILPAPEELVLTCTFNGVLKGVPVPLPPPSAYDWDTVRSPVAESSSRSSSSVLPRPLSLPLSPIIMFSYSPYTSSSSGRLSRLKDEVRKRRGWKKRKAKGLEIIVTMSVKYTVIRCYYLTMMSISLTDAHGFWKYCDATVMKILWCDVEVINVEWRMQHLHGLD